MGPIWGRQDPVGPHVGPLNLAIWVLYQHWRKLGKKSNTSGITYIFEWKLAAIGGHEEFWHGVTVEEAFILGTLNKNISFFITWTLLLITLIFIRDQSILPKPQLSSCSWNQCIKINRVIRMTIRHVYIYICIYIYYIYTMKPVCNDHLYNKIYFLWFIQ